MAEIAADAQLLDARGLRCPLPVLKTEKRLASLPAGASLRVLATDPMARIDIPLYCVQHGYACDTAEENGVLTFTIQRAG